MHSLLALGSLCLLRLVSAQTGTATSPPTTSSTATSGGGNVSIQYNLKYHNCNPTQQQAVLDALGEAHTILTADGNQNINNHWNDMAAMDFLGNPLTIKNNGGRAGLKTNLDNARSFSDYWTWFGYKMEIYCGDGSIPTAPYSTACSTKSQYPDPIVVANNYNGGATAMMFCDEWFYLETLGAAIKDGKAVDSYDVSYYDNRARHWITAMLLDRRIGTQPKNSQGQSTMAYQKYRFGSTNPRFAVTAKWAKLASKAFLDQSTITTLNNPDSISWYALSQYVSSQIGNYPVRPYVP